MVWIGRVEVKCAKCGTKSEQPIVERVDYSVTPKEVVEELRNRPQKCPHCGYEAKDISGLTQDEGGEK